MKEQASEQKNFLDLVLGLMAEVHPGESLTAILLATNLFLLLAAYYIIRPVREALILTGGGADIKSYTSSFHALLFLFIVPIYGTFAAKVNRIRLINWLFIIFASNLGIFFLLGRTGIPLGIPFFLWVGIFNLMTIAQIWSLANDLYNPEQGKRLFAIIGIGSSVGAIAGSRIAGMLIKPVGIHGMMLVSAAILLFCLVLTNLINLREKARGSTTAQRVIAEQPLGHDGGFQLILKHRYLLFTGLLTLLINVVNTNGEYMLGKAISREAAEAVAAGTGGGLNEGELIGSYYAGFQFCQNLLGRSDSTVSGITHSKILRCPGRALHYAADLALRIQPLCCRSDLRLHSHRQNFGKQHRLLLAK